MSKPTANWPTWLADQAPSCAVCCTQTRSEADAEDVAGRHRGGGAESHGSPPDLPLVYATSAGAPWTARSTDRRKAREEAASDVTEIWWFDDR